MITSVTHPTSQRHGGRTHLPSGLVHSKVVAELFLRHGARCIDLVAEDEERHLGELLDREQRVQLGLALREALKVGAVHKEDNPVHLREVVAPEPACCRAGWMLALQR
jgi:hypothetical protein